MENLEITVMNLVVNSSSARSYAMEAIYSAKAGDFVAAAVSMDKCESELETAHEYQTQLIQLESKGEDVPLNLFLIHAQDHLMNAAVVRDLAAEMIDLYKRISGAEDA